MNTGKAFWLFGLVAVLLLGGCSGESDKRWEERQITLLKDYLDKSGATYGEILFDSREKAWTIKDFSISMEYDYYPGQQFTLSAKSLTGVGVALEPVSEVSMLAKKIAYTDVVMGVPGLAHGVTLDEMIIEDFTGGPEAQKYLLGFTGGVVQYDAYKGMSCTMSCRGIAIPDELGQELFAVQNVMVKFKDRDEFGPLTMTGLVATPSLPGFEALTIDEISVEKIHSPNYAVFMKKLAEAQLTVEKIVDPTVAMEFVTDLRYDVSGGVVKKISFLFDEKLPPLTVDTVEFEYSLNTGECRQVFHVKDMTVEPELLKSLVPYRLLDDYPFPVYTFSGDLDYSMWMSEKGVDKLQLNNLALREETLGGFSLKCILETRASKAFSEGGSEAGDIPGDTAESFDTELYPQEDTVGYGPDSMRDVQLVITDKALLKTVFDVISVSGALGESSADLGPNALRTGMALGVSMQCKEYEGNLQKTCFDVVQFLNKGGTIEFSLGFDKPVPYTVDSYSLNDDMGISSTYTAPAE